MKQFIWHIQMCFVGGAAVGIVLVAILSAVMA